MTRVPFCEHTSKAMAAGNVLLPDILVELVRANDHEGSRRMEHLREAETQALDLLKDIQAAIRAEQPARVPVAATAGA